MVKDHDTHTHTYIDVLNLQRKIYAFTAYLCVILISNIAGLCNRIEGRKKKICNDCVIEMHACMHEFHLF